MSLAGPGIGGGAILPAGAVIWLDASNVNGDGIAPADGAPIERWVDVSGAGVGSDGTTALLQNDAVQINTGDQPTYVASSGLNGMPAIRFVQDNDDNGDDMIFDNHGGTNGDNLAAQVPTGASWFAVTTINETGNKRYNIFGNRGEDGRLSPRTGAR